MYLLNNVCTDLWGYGFYFIIWFILQYYCYFILFSLEPLRVLSGLLLCPFNPPPSFYNVSGSLISIPTSCLRLCIFSCPDPRISRFSEEFQLLALENSTGNRDQGAGVLQSLFLSSTLGDRWPFLCQFRCAGEPPLIDFIVAIGLSNSRISIVSFIWILSLHWDIWWEIIAIFSFSSLNMVSCSSLSIFIKAD